MTDMPMGDHTWLAWVRAGSPRDRDGRPVVEAQTGRKGRAA